MVPNYGQQKTASFGDSGKDIRTRSSNEALRILEIVLHVSICCDYRMAIVISLLLSSGCAEFFGIRNGEEYMVSHYLFKKPAAGSS